MDILEIGEHLSVFLATFSLHMCKNCYFQTYTETSQTYEWIFQV